MTLDVEQETETKKLIHLALRELSELRRYPTNYTRNTNAMIYLKLALQHLEG